MDWWIKLGVLGTLLSVLIAAVQLIIMLGWRPSAMKPRLGELMRWLSPAFAISVCCFWLVIYYFNPPATLSVRKWPSYEFSQVADKTYKDTTIIVDGYHFINCTFDHVTFRYKGTAPVQFTDAHFPTAPAIRSSNPIVTNVMRISAAFERMTSPETCLPGTIP
jgi:hypothetical protein